MNNLRRHIIMQQADVWPGAYQEVEYIEFNGDAYQYIETIIPIGECDISIPIYITGSPSRDGYTPAIWGAYGYPVYLGYMYWSNHHRLVSINTFSYFIQTGVKYNIRIICHNGIVETYNEDVLIYSVNQPTIPQYATIIINRNSSSKAGDIYGKFRIYHTTGVSSGMVVNLMPCYRKSDAVAGLYDITNGIFYTNAGTGEFIVGPAIMGGA